MTNEIDIRDNAQVPSNVVNQNGSKNIHVGHADNLTNNNITCIIPVTEKSETGERTRKNLSLRKDYYHLFVAGGETFSTDHFLMPKERALPFYFTNEEIRKKYGSLSDEVIDEILAFPALLMPEASGFNAQAGDDQLAIFAYLQTIRVQDNGVKIRFNEICTFDLRSIAGIGFELGMVDMDRAISEINRTHWSIKRINLIEELTDAGISILGINT